MTKRTDIANVDALLAARAGKIKEQISRPTSASIRIDRDGNFVGPDNVLLGNEIRVVIVDFCSANRYYDRAFDPNSPAPPACFSFGQELSEMAPFDESPVKQADDCASCPHNQFGSRGNGKACKNTRELAVILEDELEEESPTLYSISVPPTGLKSFDGVVNAIARQYNAPPIRCIVTVLARKEATYQTMSFTDFEPNPNYARHFELVEAAEDVMVNIPDVSKYVPLGTRPAAKPAPRPARR